MLESITISQQLTAGLYWLVVVSNGTPTLRCHAIGGVIPLLGHLNTLPTTAAYIGLYASFTYAALPTTFPTTCTLINATPIPSIFVRLSA